MRLILFVFILFICLPAQAEVVETCGCTPMPFESRLYQADAVFVGVVQEIKEIKEYKKPSARDIPIEVTILVDDAYKGAENGKKFTLHTSLTRDTCTGHPFELWKKYLVFAYARKAEVFEYWSLYNFPSGTFDVGGLCGGTKEIGSPEAAADLVPLQALQKEAEEKARAEAAKKKKK